jgi:hypothetical protein
VPNNPLQQEHIVQLSGGSPVSIGGYHIVPVDHNPFDDSIGDKERQLLHQNILTNRAATDIQTLDPGRTWNNMDQNAIDPANMQAPFQEDI